MFWVLLDVRGDDDGLDLAELEDAARLAPAEELAHGVGVGGPGVLVADICGKELDEAPAGALTGAGDRCRQMFEAGPARGRGGLNPADPGLGRWERP